MNVVKKCRHGDMVFQTNDVYVGRSFDLYGEFSEGEVDLFRQLIKPGQVVLDIGANIGAHTIPLAQLVGPGGRVLAFEPQRMTYYTLCANVVLNNLGNVICHQAAVGEAAGTLTVPDLDHRAELNFGGVELDHDFSHLRQTYTVPILTVDDLRLDACHFMKIDVEGMEKKVLAGAVETIRRLRPILYVEDDRMDRSAELRAFLEHLGFELYVHRPPLYNVENFFRNPQNIFGRIISLNLYCHPRELPSPVNPAAFRMVSLRHEAAARASVPDEAGRAYRQGIQCAQQGKLEEAIAKFEQALRLNPDYAVAHSDLGNVFYLQGRHEAAVASYERALRLNPDFPVAHNNMGAALTSLGRYEEAAAHCRSALVLRPDYAEAHNNLGNALNDQGQLPEAITHYREAVRLKPDYAVAYNNLGLALVESGECAEAARYYDEALRLKPDYAEAHLNRALLWLLLGELERGWPEYQWRWRCQGFPTPGFRQPVWNGSPLQGRTILLHAEQALGDTLQFIRYAPLVQQREGRVLVMAQPALLPLLASAPGMDGLVEQGSALPDFDTHAPLLNLPAIFGTTLATIPAEVPYLWADPAAVERWRRQIDSLLSETQRAFRIGIAWQGNSKHKRDRHRSLPLAHFEPLARLPGVQLLSLQVGPGVEQLRSIGERFPVVDLGSRFDPASFADVAAVMASLDLVISVDSAVGHLAGALGHPVWLLLPFAPDWRWLRGRADSPWYPTMRLFRQKEAGDWEGVFESVVNTLAKQRAGDMGMSVIQ